MRETTSVKDLDELDLGILRLLLSDADTSYKEIARKTESTIGTVHNRIKRMKEEGVITGAAAGINMAALGYDICVLMDVQITGGKLEAVENKLSKNPNVCAIYDVTGDFDTTLVAKFRSTLELDRFVKTLLEDKNILRTSTKLVLNIVKEGSTPAI